MNYHIISKKLDEVERSLRKFVEEVTPEIENQINIKEKESRKKFKELKDAKLPKRKLNFSIKRKDDYILFTDPAPESPIKVLRKRAGRKMAKFLESSLKSQVPDIKVKWIKGD